MKSKRKLFAIVDASDSILWTYPTLMAAKADLAKAQRPWWKIKLIPDMKASKRESNHLA